ncbi:hypothetical protein [Brevibacillus borstelensis]|uniref:hypothetical protein n=1 Tax=Brevibacillus borstelensis TaxID=45462 RepID=UPI003CF20D7C
MRKNIEKIRENTSLVFVKEGAEERIRAKKKLSVNQGKYLKFGQLTSKILCSVVDFVGKEVLILFSAQMEMYPAISSHDLNDNEKQVFITSCRQNLYKLENKPTPHVWKQQYV